MTNLFRFFALIFIALGAMALSCHTYSTQPGGVPSNPLNLHAVLVTPNEVQIAWSNPAAANNVYRLVRNGAVLFDSLAIPKNDSSFTYKDSGVVVPSTQYTYKLYRVLSNDSSSLTVTTLPVSRDNYNFTETNIGIGGSIIYSIWGASPQSIWLVGLIDTMTDKRNSNVLHIQNGLTTYYQLLGGSPIYYSVYGLNDSDIYFGGQSILWHWNGTIFDYSVPFLNDSVTMQVGIITGLWVSSNDEVFCGDNNGNIVHRKNGTWINEPTGTTEIVWNIYGFNATDVYAACSWSNIDGTVLHYTQNGWSTLVQSDSTNGFPAINSVYGVSDDSLIAVGAGVMHRVGNTWQNRQPQNEVWAYLEDVKSLADNNYWICGYYGFIAHWDGLQYVIYNNYYNLNSSLAFYHILQFPNDVFIVGADNNTAWFVHGS